MHDRLPYRGRLRLPADLTQFEISVFFSLPTEIAPDLAILWHDLASLFLWLNIKESFQRVCMARNVFSKGSVTMSDQQNDKEGLNRPPVTLDSKAVANLVDDANDLDERGEPDGALKLYREALHQQTSLDSESGSDTQQFIQLLIARLLHKTKRLDEAIISYKELLSLAERGMSFLKLESEKDSQTDAEYYKWELALILLESSQFDESILLLRELLSNAELKIIDLGKSYDRVELVAVLKSNLGDALQKKTASENSSIGYETCSEEHDTCRETVS